MAKKTMAKRNGRRGRPASTRDSIPVMEATGDSIGEDRDYKEILREFLSRPAVKYVAGGIATAMLTRLANNMAEKYPEISDFIRENMENLEGKLGEFRATFQDSARH